MTAAEVCRVLGIGPIRLLLLLQRGELRITEESVEAYIASHLPAVTP
jgi:hypothetical protein